MMMKSQPAQASGVLCGDGDDNDDGNDDKKLTSPCEQCSEDGLLASSRPRQSLRAENAATELVVAKTVDFTLVLRAILGSAGAGEEGNGRLEGGRSSLAPHPASDT